LALWAPKNTPAVTAMAASSNATKGSFCISSTQLFRCGDFDQRVVRIATYFAAAV
jgi:hypothetical protein